MRLQDIVIENVSFVTSKGSNYRITDKGTTIRNKAARSDLGHENDFGTKSETEITIYLKEPETREISMWASSNATKKRPVIRGNVLYLTSINSLTNQRGSDGKLSFNKDPEIGLYPLELWLPSSSVNGGYQSWHIGNKIIKINRE